MTRAHTVALLVLVVGCTSRVPAGGGTDSPVSEAVESAAPEAVHSPAGYLDYENSLVHPSCNAVLIAPDLVLTAAACVEQGAYDLSFGTGELGGRTVPVRRVELHPDAARAGHALALVHLTRKILDVAPARFRSSMRDLGCDVELPTYVYRAEREGKGEARSIWSACQSGPLDSPEFIAADGFPGCHGDAGAAAFVSGTNDLLGIVVASGYDGPRHPVSNFCVSSVELATVEANLDFLTSAVEKATAVAPLD